MKIFLRRGVRNHDVCLTSQRFSNLVGYVNASVSCRPNILKGYNEDFTSYKVECTS